MLSAAVDLSPPLDERSLPRYQTLPRRRRRRVIPALVVDVGQEVTQEHFPHLQSPERDEPGTTGEESGLSNQESISNPSDILTVATPGMHPVFRTVSSRRAAESEEEELDQDGKWAPRHALSPEANMRLARRCMAELFADAPRQSNFVVERGQRFRLLYDSKQMVPELGSDISAGTSGCGSGMARGKGKGKELAEDVKLPRLPEYEEVISEHQEAIVATS